MKLNILCDYYFLLLSYKVKCDGMHWFGNCSFFVSNITFMYIYISIMVYTMQYENAGYHVFP